MAIDLKKHGVKDAEAWSSGVLLPVGWHTVQITEADDSEKSSGNHDQIVMRFEGAAGDIRDWLVLTEGTAGKLASLLDAVGIDRAAIDTLEVESLVGKKLSIYVGEERDRQDPTKMRKRVQAYDSPGKGGGNGVLPPADTSGFGEPTADDDDLPF